MKKSCFTEVQMVAILREADKAPGPDPLRKHILERYPVPYAQIDASLYLPVIRHHRQLWFDSQAHRSGASSNAGGNRS